METEHIWQQFKDQLLLFLKSKVPADISEDILQDVFVKIHLKKHQLQDQNKLNSWVYQITRNAIIDYYKKNKLVLSEEIADKSAEEQTEEINHPQFLNCMLPFIKTLSENDQDILKNTLINQQSQKDYASANNLAYSTVKSRSQRAKQKLKEKFIQCCDVKTDKYGNIISSDIDNCSC